MGHGGRLEREDGWSQSAGGIASRSRLYLSTSKFSSDTCVTLLASRFHRIRIQKGHTSPNKNSFKGRNSFPLPTSINVKKESRTIRQSERRLCHVCNVRIALCSPIPDQSPRYKRQVVPLWEKVALDHDLYRGGVQWPPLNYHLARGCNCSSLETRYIALKLRELRGGVSS